MNPSILINLTPWIEGRMREYLVGKYLIPCLLAYFKTQRKSYLSLFIYGSVSFQTTSVGCLGKYLF